MAPYLAPESDRRTMGEVVDTMSYWVVGATPRLYRIEEAVAERQYDWWTMGRYKFAPGDRVAIWKFKGRDDYRGILSRRSCQPSGPPIRRR